MNARCLAGFGLAGLLWITPARAADVIWRPATAGRPAAALGRPVAAPAPRRPIFRAQAGDVPPVPPIPAPYGPSVSPVPPGAGLPPCPPGGVAPPPPIPPAELYNQGVVPDTPAGAGGPSFWDKTKQMFDLQSGPLTSCGRKPFQSDHAFDNFISPVSNPFLFEDPRSLTELRPIYMYQSIPSKNDLFHGGDAMFFGTQARVALTDRWSIVMSKIGGVSLNPSEPFTPGYEGGSGFAELNIGPKWTFIRNERSGTVGALGVNFQVPLGDSKVFQDIGTLSVVPYMSFAQAFGRSSYGSFNAMSTFGFTIATDSARSDTLFTSLHLDYDIANLHKFYPLLELNWTYFTSNGGANNISFEGRDLFNFGSMNVSGNNNLTLAAGLRYKFKECAQFGTALEFPIAGRHDMMDFRFTIDFILRY